MPELESISRAECERHLRAEAVARVAVCTPDGPHIVPVNYTLADDALLVLTSSASVLGVHAPGSVVGLEVDGVSAAYHSGWSVVVRGRAESVTITDHLAEPRTWIPRENDVLLRIPLDGSEVTGRLLPAKVLPAPGAS